MENKTKGEYTPLEWWENLFTKQNQEENKETPNRETIKNIGEEIENIEKYKNYGTNGISRKFNIAFWDTIGNDLTETPNNIILQTARFYEKCYYYN